MWPPVSYRGSEPSGGMCGEQAAQDRTGQTALPRGCSDLDGILAFLTSRGRPVLGARLAPE